jgi:hypothetical protein
LRIN